MLTAQACRIYIRSYWMLIVALLIALLTYNVLAYWAHTESITPQEAYDHMYNEYPGNTDIAEYVRDRCELYGCRIDGSGSLIIRDP